MLKILLLDCRDSLHEKLLREGFDVEAGTIGMCTGVRKLPSQVYEKDLFFYDPEGANAAGTRDSIKNETPQYRLSHLESRIRVGATFVAFVNPVLQDPQFQNDLYGWIPFMPKLSFTHDQIVSPRSFIEPPANEYAAFAPLVLTDEISRPVLVKLAPPERDQQYYVPDVLSLFWNGNGDCLGVIITRGHGRLVVLPRFKSNSEIIETFLHRVVPKLYRMTSPSGLIDLYRSPLQKSASAELEDLLTVEKEVLARQGVARSQLAAAIRAKAKVIGDDATAKQVLIYYDLARRQDDAALFYLYKMIETVENKFGGEYEAIKTVGASTEWQAVKRLANESYRDARHAPKPSEVVKKWTNAEPSVPTSVRPF